MGNTRSTYTDVVFSAAFADGGFFDLVLGGADLPPTISDYNGVVRQETARLGTRFVDLSQASIPPLAESASRYCPETYSITESGFAREDAF